MKRDRAVFLSPPDDDDDDDVDDFSGEVECVMVTPIRRRRTAIPPMRLPLRLP